MIGRHVMFKRPIGLQITRRGDLASSAELVSGMVTDEWTEWKVFRGEGEFEWTYQVLLSDGALVEAKRHELNFFAWQ